MSRNFFSFRSTFCRMTSALLLALCAATVAASDVSFDAVAAGDVTSTDVILWTRAKDSADPTTHSVTLKVATDANITAVVFTQAGNADPVNDFTVKINATGLTAGTKYYYRWESAGGAMSNVGRFKTAPSPTSAVAVKFAFSGDADGQWRPFPSVTSIANENLDFFAFLGDTMYENASTADSPGVPAADIDLDPAGGYDTTNLLFHLRTKYRENILPQPNVTPAGADTVTSSLKNFFAAQANYTLFDNHELCSNVGSNATRGLFQAGGAPQPADLRTYSPYSGNGNDANVSGTFMNKSAGFLACIKAYSNYEPIREHTISAVSDPRTDQTQQMYLSQQWGKNMKFIHTDCRSYRDMRMFSGVGPTGTTDDTGVRADNASRTMFGATQLAWLKTELLNAQAAGTKWKIVTISDPIDQVGPISGTLGSFTPSVTSSDGGKSFMGGYRAERNDMLKFIADNKILNVVFLATDDHMTRVNEVRYFPTFPATTATQATSVLVPACFTVVTGPIGASGPEGFTDHSFASLKTLADSVAAAQTSNNIDPVGLSPYYPGLHNVYREGDPNADITRGPVDFFSPDTFNYTTLEISADGNDLTVSTYGINSFLPTLFKGPNDPANPLRKILSFEVSASTGADVGVSTTQTPYLVPAAPGVQTKAILSVGDTVAGKRMAGIPDGLGAYDNGNGTFTLLMNHEIGNTLGSTRAHGSKGAFVSKWTIDKSTLAVTALSDLIQSVITWNAGTLVYNSPGTTAFNRFCSADLPAQTAFIGATAGYGTSDKIFMNGEETSSGRAFAHIATGTYAGTSVELPRLGKVEHENCLACPVQQDKTIVVTNSDTSPLGQVFVYVGTKMNTAVTSALDVVNNAGLRNGTLYGVTVTGVSTEDRFAALGAVKGSSLPFTLSSLGTFEDDTDGSKVNAAADLKQVTRFLRPEDGAWDPTHGNDYYFVTTDRIDTQRDGLGTQAARSRLWRLRFTNIAAPENGGTITMLLDGTEGGNMFDNLCVDRFGNIMLQEDTGNAAHNAKIFRYDTTSGVLELVASHDAARFGDVNVAATLPFNQDEESSGIMDASSILGPGWFLCDVQAHYDPKDAELVEGGQLVALYVPAANPSTRIAKGSSSSATPYLVPVDAGVQLTSIATVGDTFNKKTDNVSDYRMVGIPDGLGAFDNGDGTFTLLMNHELGAAAGVSREHGSAGALVSKWKINKTTLQVSRIDDLIQANGVFTWDPVGLAYNAGGTYAFTRFCSADLPAASAFDNISGTGNGTTVRIFMNGEETAGGRAFAHVVTGVDAGHSFEIPSLGKMAHENCVACPYRQDKTIVATTDDNNSPGGQVYFYIGTKTNTGSDVDKAGLTNGKLYGVVVPSDSDYLENSIAGIAGLSKNVPGVFTLADLGDRKADPTASPGTLLESDSDTAKVMKFRRPEDGCWDPSNPTDYFFVTTDALDTVRDGIGTGTGRSRLWRLRFNDITQPEQGGTITMLLDGNEGQNMLDNLTIDSYGRIILQEDTGSGRHNAKIWLYEIATGSLKIIAKHDPARFGDVYENGSAPFNQGPNGTFGNSDDFDEESSGVMDASAILGPGWFLLDVQAHYTDGGATITPELAEGGQLLAMFVPLSGGNPNALQGISSSASPYVVPVENGAKTISVFTAGDTVNKKPDGVTDYRMVGIPDGMGGFDNGDGTFTLLMNHELTNAEGAVRAHGSIGAFVSKWTINKKTLQVNKVEDLIQTVNTWNGTQYVPGTTAFNRFCSADLPAVSALYNSTTGRGTTERIFMNGEETANGRLMAHVVTGPNAGNSYQLPRFGRTGSENSVANPYPQDKTIVMVQDDSNLPEAATPHCQVYCYIGTKNSTGTLEIDKAGLTNGILYGICVPGDSDFTEDQLTGIMGVTKTNSGAPFTLVSLGNRESDTTGATLETDSDAAKIMRFRRPEDGCWDPSNPRDYYFVTTDQLDTVKDGLGVQVGRSRLWRLRFNDILNPEYGGTIQMLLDGTEAQNMLDNMTIDKSGHILLQEDPGKALHNAKIWLYDINSGALKMVAKHDPLRFGDLNAAGNTPFINGVDGDPLATGDNFDEESSGIFDASELLGPGWFLLAVQAHYKDGGATITSELVEGGQLVALFVPDAASTTVAFTTTGQVVNEGVGTVTISAKLNAAYTSAISVPYTVSGTATFSSTLAGGGDHNLANGVITIPTGSLVGTKTFSVWNDTIHEANETVIVTLGTTTNAVLGTPSVHTVLIQDNDAAIGASVTNDAVSTNEDTAVTTQNLLTNDVGINGVAPVYGGSTAPTNGTLVDNKDGTFVYTPTANYYGSDSFTYTVSDSQATFKQTNVPTLVTVTGTNTGTVNLPNGGYGSAIAAVPGSTSEFYILTDRGPNADALGGGKLFPKPDFSPQIGRFRLEGDGTLTRLNTIILRRADGTPLTGQPIPTGTGSTGEVTKDLSNANVPGDSEGLDSEGLVAMADGTFWVSDEYGPFLVHFDASGKTIERISPTTAAPRKLPLVLLNRVINKGMESLTVTPDGTTLVGMMQNALNNPRTALTGTVSSAGTTITGVGTNFTTEVAVNDFIFAAGQSKQVTAIANNTSMTVASAFSPDIPAGSAAAKGPLIVSTALRIVTLNIATGATKQYVYLLEASNLGVSDITAVSDHEFLALERDGKFPNDPGGAIKNIFKFDIAAATDISDANDTLKGTLYGGLTLEEVTQNLTNAQAKTALATNSVTPVTKTLVIDIGTKFKSVYNHDKMEGITTINGGKTIVISNDDDFVLDTDTNAANTTQAQRVKVKKSTAGVTDSSELLFINLATATVAVTVVPVNDVPSFTKGLDQTVAEDAALQTVTGWATAISTGPVNENSQTVSFIVTNDNNALFSDQPAVSPTGTLTYKPAANANGTATVTVSVKDSGGGTDTSATQTFTITVTPVNDPPSFTKGADQSVDEDAGAQSVSAWATNITAGAADETSQTLTFTVTNDKNELFSAQPAVASNGTLTYTPAANANGSAMVTVKLKDNGGGTDTSAAQTFIITIRPVNDAPTITSEASATPAIAKVGDAVSFVVTASDIETANLTYDWSFGDGGTGTGASATHAYGTPGIYGATVKVTDAGGLSVTSSVKVTIVAPAEAGNGTDTDHDGFSDAIETAAGSSTTNPNDTPTGGAAMTLPLPLADAKLAIKLNFAKPGNDAIGFAGTILLSEGTTLGGKKFTVDVGGVAKSFTLDEKGGSKSGGDAVGIKAKGTAARTAKFAVKLTKGNFASTLAADGLANVNASKNVNVPLTVIFDGQVYQKTQVQSYKAKAGKTGATKDAK